MGRIIWLTVRMGFVIKGKGSQGAVQPKEKAK